MSVFSENELAYIQTQKLGRLATLSTDGAPNNVPVTFRYNAELGTIDIGGYKLSTSKKFRNVLGDGRVSFVIDDVLPPWEPRGIEIRGTAEAIIARQPQGEERFGDALIRVTPRHIISWGIDTHPYTRNSRKVEA
ncbi:MAG: PPOX class F420-dependent oxidoreductase [Chloroflexota bacterium]|nr:PPOX class F420-dependent oxidoreductase [Chloroflexota bacterium]